jgi:Protein of unknown function (DUF3017)
MGTGSRAIHRYRFARRASRPPVVSCGQALGPGLPELEGRNAGRKYTAERALLEANAMADKPSPSAVGRGSRASGAVGPAPRAPDATAGRGPHAPDATAGRGPRAAARAKPPRAAQLPYLFVLAITIGALAWIWQGGIQHAKEGTLALAGAMFIGALARLVLPKPRAGMLASRRRLVDVVCLAALAVGLLVAGLVLPIPS